MKQRSSGAHARKQTVTKERTASSSRVRSQSGFAQNIRLQAVVLAVFAVLLSIQTVTYDFTMDDVIVITENRFVQRGLAGIPDILTKSTFAGNERAEEKKDDLSGGRYRPLTLVMFAIEWKLFGGKPAGFHVLNVVCNAALTVVLFFTLRLLLSTYNLRIASTRAAAKKSERSAHGQHDDRHDSQHSEQSAAWLPVPVLERYPLLPFFAVALFVAQPTHTEVVANIKSRDEILCLLFSLGALYYFVLYCRSGAVRDVVLSGVAYLLALFTKETAITYLFVMPFTAWFFAPSLATPRASADSSEGSSADSSTNSSANSSTVPVTAYSLLPRMATVFGVVAIVAAGFLLLRAQIVGFVDNRVADNIFDNPFLYATPAERYATPVAILLRYFVSSLYPFVLAFDYSFNAIPLMNWTHWQTVLSIVIHLGLLTIAVWGLPRRNLLAYCLWYYFATISIVSNIVFSIGALMGDRFLFMPTVGTSLGIAYCVILFAENRIAVRTLTLERARVFVAGSLSVLLLMYSVRTVTRNPVWQSNEALHISSLETYPQAMRSYRLRATVLIEKAGKATTPQERDLYASEAYQLLWKSIQIDSLADDDVYFRLGQYHSLLYNNMDSGLYYYEKIARLKPKIGGYQFYYHLTRGNWFLDKMMIDSAEKEYILAQQYGLQPEMTTLNIGVVRMNQGRYEEAVKLFEEAIRLSPSFDRPRKALAYVQQLIKQRALQQQAQQQSQQQSQSQTRQ